MKKICGNCKYFAFDDELSDDEIIALDNNPYEEWGFCFGPVPMSVEDVGHGEVEFNQKAKECPTFKKRKDKK